MAKLIIGLTGGVASGKTTVAGMFADLGVPVFSADVVARELVMPGAPALRAIQTHFGDSVILPDGGLDREALRTRILKDVQEKSWLEHLLHPEIVRILNERAAEVAAPYCVIEIPLLVETDLAFDLDRILVVTAPENIRMQRCQKDLQEFMALQATEAERLQHADDVIHNDGTLEELKEQVLALHDKYMGGHSKEMSMS